MSMNSRGKEVGAKKEDEAEVDDNKLPKIITSSRQWSSSFKNPRIVRVSRTFGGKDRHSKVCTVRGLRDRRIRLSVPTAIQLYDLQDRLGLSQPSKVIDWLLDATKHEIDKLPPLPIIPTNFLHFHQPLSNIHHIPHDPSPYVHDHQFLPPNLYKNDDDQEGFGGFVAQLSAHNFFPLNTQFSVPYNFQLDTTSTPNLSLSQFGGGFSFSDHQTDQEHSSSSSQIYMCPSATATTPNFPHYIAPSMENHDQFRQINHLQNMATTLHLINPTLKSFTLNDEEKDNRSS